MPQVGPAKRQHLIRCLRQLRFEGPYVEGRHRYMVRREIRFVLPNPHRGDIGVELLTCILKQAGISREEWERLQ